MIYEKAEIKRADGSLKKTEWLQQEGLPHRPEEEGPAQVLYDEDGTTILVEKYYRDGALHREKGPAVVSYQDQIPEYVAWFCNGRAHRGGNQPAKISKRNRFKEWWVDNARHREDGPAVVFYTSEGNPEKGEFYIKGVRMSLSEMIDRPQTTASQKKNLLIWL